MKTTKSLYIVMIEIEWNESQLHLQLESYHSIRVSSKHHFLIFCSSQTRFLTNFLYQCSKSVLVNTMNTSPISDVSLTPPLSSSTVNPIQFNYFINPKLDENNFLLWKSQVLPVIRGLLLGDMNFYRFLMAHLLLPVLILPLILGIAKISYFLSSFFLLFHPLY
jgi:hypothetical protein